MIAAPRIKRIARGAAAGLAGTAVLTLLAEGERRRRGGPAVFEPGRMAGRLAQRHLGVELSVRQRRCAGQLMRWPYGAAWGVVLSAVGGVVPRARAWPVRGAALGGAVLAFELIALPLVGATPGLRQWGRDEIVSDGVNTLAYGLVAAAILAAPQRAAAPHAARSGRPHGGS